MRRLSRRLAVVPLAFGLVAGAAVFHGCTIMNGLTVPERDAGPDVEGDGYVDPCDHAYAPFDPPQLVEDGTISFVTAIRSIDLDFAKADAGVDGGPEFAGFDLDRTCTCPAPPSCTRTVAGVECDDDRGRDNAFVTLVRGLDAKGVDIQSRSVDGFQKGANAVLIIVDGYNGQKDDPKVQVKLTGSPGLRDVFPDGGLSQKKKPTFTTADPWLLDKQEFNAIGSVIQGKNLQEGYVKDGRLVVKLEKGSITLGEEGLSVQLTTGFIVGEIATDPSGAFYVANGELGGRWSTRDALASAREVKPTPELPPLCKLGGTLFEDVKTIVCGAVDISSDPARDNKGAACDAISVSLRFQGAAGGRGELYDRPRASECPDAAPGEAECSP